MKGIKNIEKILKLMNLSKSLMLLLLSIPFNGFLFSQSPSKISYQAIVRNSLGTLVTNKSIGMRISVLKGGPTGSPVYTETHQPFSNANGLITIEIGSGSVVFGDFSQIDWGSDSYFYSTEIDPNGGTNYSIFGVSQFLSVPYAFHANVADSVKNIKLPVLKLEKIGDTISINNYRIGLNDDDAFNEIQILRSSNDSIILSKNGGSISLKDNDPTNEIQQIEFKNDTLSLTKNGGWIRINDFDKLNEIQQLSKSNDSLFLSKLGGVVKLNDDDNTNEIQQINKNKDTIFLSKGGMIKLTDDDTLNEIQNLKISNDTLRLSKSNQFVILGNKLQDTINGNITEVGHGTFSGTYNTNPTTVFNSFTQVWDLSCQIDLGSNTYIMGVENYVPQSVINFNNSNNALTKLKSINSNLRNSYPNIYETMTADKSDTSFTWFNSKDFTIYKAKTDTYVTYPISNTANSSFFSLLTMSNSPASYQYQVIKIAKKKDTLMILFQKADKTDYGFYIYKYIGSSDKLIPVDSFDLSAIDGTKAIVNSQVTFQFNTIDYLIATGDFKPITYNNKIMLGIALLKNLRNKQTKILNIGQTYSETVIIPFQNKFVIWNGGVRTIIDVKSGICRNFTVGSNTIPDNSRNTLFARVGGHRNLGNVIFNNGKFGLLGALGNYGSSLNYGLLFYVNIK